MNLLKYGPVGLLVLSSACTVSGGTARLGTVARQSVASFHSLGQQVSGEACSSPLATDDYRKAALIALQQAPGANALTDVTLESREILSGGFCLRVSGTAGVLQ